LFEHDLIRKPVSTFRDHALKPKAAVRDRKWRLGEAAIAGALDGTVLRAQAPRQNAHRVEREIRRAADDLGEKMLTATNDKVRVHPASPVETVAVP
jgi:hypothetical protein